MERNKIDFWGHLDVAARTLEDIQKSFNALWNSEEYRMKEADILRMSEYLARVRKSEKDIREVLKLFTPLITKHDEQPRA